MGGSAMKAIVVKRLERIGEAGLFLVVLAYTLVFFAHLEAGDALEIAVLAFIAQIITQVLIGLVQMARSEMRK